MNIDFNLYKREKMKKTLLIFVILLQVGCSSEKYYYSNNKKVVLSPVESISRNNAALDYYKTQNDVKVGVGNAIIVKFFDDKNLNNYLEEFGLTLEKKLDKNLYLFKTVNKSFTIDISNKLYIKPDIKYAHPDFVKKLNKR